MLQTGVIKRTLMKFRINFRKKRVKCVLKTEISSSIEVKSINNL